MQAKRDGKPEDAERSFARNFTPTSQNCLARLRAYRQFQHQAIDQAGAAIQANAASGRTGLAVLGGAVLLIGVVAGFRIAA